MKFIIDLGFWIIAIPIFGLLLFYEPVFTITVLGITIGIGIIGGVLLWAYRNRKN